jgi:agmatinase
MIQYRSPFYAGRGPLTVVQVDGHVDWGDVIKDNPNGYGSTMRRAAEMPWVTTMIQVGIGGLGSGTADQIVDARGWGSHIFTARDIRRAGMQRAIDAIPEGADCIVTIGCDGLDPSCMPAVGMPAPGGIGYLDLLDLLHGVAKKGRIAGFFSWSCVLDHVAGRVPVIVTTTHFGSQICADRSAHSRRGRPW